MRTSTPAFDTPHHDSVSLDRAEKTLIFQLGDELQSIVLSTDLFLPSNHYTRARAQIVNGTGLVVIGIDNLKTDNIHDDFSYNSMPVLLVRGVADGSGEVVSETTDYQMSINFDHNNSKLVFGLNDEVVEIAVTTPLNVPYRVAAYVSADTNGVDVGTAVVNFDNLRVDCPADSQTESCQPRSSGRDVADNSSSDNTSNSSGSGGSLG